MKVTVAASWKGNYTVWIGNYRLLFEGSQGEADAIALQFKQAINRSGKHLTVPRRTC